MHCVTLIPGDGIGPKITPSARDIVTASGADVAWELASAGMNAGAELGTPLPQSAIDSIRRNTLALKGPTQTSFGAPYRVRVADRVYPSVTIGLRKELGFYAAVRPIENYPSVRSRYDNVDFVIYRENSEDRRGATARIARFAFEHLGKLGRKKLTIAHTANVLKMTDGLFLGVAQKLDTPPYVPGR